MGVVIFFVAFAIDAILRDSFVDASAAFFDFASAFDGETARPKRTPNRMNLERESMSL